MKGKRVIIVVPAEKGKFKVLDNYVQVGVDYSTEELAEVQADKLRIKRGIPIKANQS